MIVPSPSRMYGGFYCPYVPLSTHNKISWGEGWQRPDRKDCASLYCVNGSYLTPDEYHAKYDDAGELRVFRLEDDPLYIQACEDCPEGKNCARCGSKNEFYDDCGWFSICGKANSKVEESYEPVCKACWDACGGSTAER